MLPELLIGFAAGVLSGMTGIGGAVVAIPLLLALGVSPHAAVGSAILLVVVAAANGAYSYSKRGLVDWPAALHVGIPGALSSIAGAWVSNQTPAPVLVYGIALVVTFFGAILLFSRRHKEPAKKGVAKRHAVALGLAVGFVSGLTGIGGGSILASSYATALGLAAHSAVATAHATILFFALPGAASHVVLGSADLIAALPLLAGGLLGSKVGVRLAVRAPEILLRKGMALLFILIGLWL